TRRETDSRAAAEIVLAVAVAARHANRLAVLVGRNHGVHAIGLARAAEVFDRFARAIAPAGDVHRRRFYSTGTWAGLAAGPQGGRSPTCLCAERASARPP